MSQQIIVRSPAEQDITAACLWYSKQGDGLDRRFLEAMDEAIQQVAMFPASAAPVDEVHRRILLQTFPYGVYYQLYQNKIVVKAVLQLAMNPEDIQKRLDE